jgi:N-methylhydantoinase B
MQLKAGDTVVIKTGGGGGWGNPLERDPEAVAQDVREGSVSRARANERYGVVVDEQLLLDGAATAARRAAGPAVG